MKKQAFVSITLFILLVLIMSCSRNNTYTVTEKDGVKIFSNKNIPFEPDLKITPKELFTIFGVDENNKDSTRLIQNISSFDVDSENNIFILDHNSCSVKKFDSEGNFVKSFGRKGTGPGESVNSYDIVILNDTILYDDSGSKKMLKLDRDGKFIKNINIKTSGMPSRFKALNKNRIIGHQEKDEKIGDAFYSSYNLTIMDNEFNMIKVLTDNKVKYDRETYNFFDLFKSSYATSNNLIFFADNSDSKYKIIAFDHEGNLKYEIVKNYIRTQFSETEYEDFMKTYNKVWYLTNNKSKYKCAIRQMEHDKYDRLWVFPSVKRDDKNKTDMLVDIFKDGVFLNQIKIDICEGMDYENLNHRIRLIGNRLYYINTIEQYIKVYDY